MRCHTWLFCLTAVLAPVASGHCSDDPELAAAFVAVFGHDAPVTRAVTPAPHGRERLTLGESRSTDQGTFDITPRMLVTLGNECPALVLTETKRQAGHAEGGAIGIAYLHRSDTGWMAERSWLDLLSSGVGGEPAPAGLELHRFPGRTTLLFARTGFCTMNSCEE